MFAAGYPILAKAQKPGGVTVLSAVSANDVPNKGLPGSPTIQAMVVEVVEEEQEESPPEEEAPPAE
jgi:hypothetical protein